MQLPGGKARYAAFGRLEKGVLLCGKSVSDYMWQERVAGHAAHRRCDIAQLGTSE